MDLEDIILPMSLSWVIDKKSKGQSFYLCMGQKHKIYQIWLKWYKIIRLAIKFYSTEYCSNKAKYIESSMSMDSMGT